MSNTITPTVFYRTLNVEGLEIFYREAGPRDAPTVLLLHGCLASKPLRPCDRVFEAMGDQVLDVSLAGHQLIHSLFRDPGPNWSAEGLSYNGETDQIEALLPSILCLWVVFDPDHILGL